MTIVTADQVRDFYRAATNFDRQSPGDPSVWMSPSRTLVHEGC
jgi:hypothetical protein